MQATNGSPVLFRSRNHLIGCVMAIMLVLSALAFASTARAEGPSQTYLALGDSLAFGYSQQLFNENFPTESPTAFEHGYTNDLLGNTVKEGVQLTNKGCPGETTDSLIGNGLLAAALKIPGESPCAYHKVGFPLHSEYGGTKSQLESALETIAVDAASGTPVTKLTLDIGANDIFRSERACKAEVKAEFEKEHKSKYGSTEAEAVQNCVKAHIPETYRHIVENTGRILFVLRNGSSFGGVNYTGKVIFLGLYDSSGAVFTPGVELFPGSVEAVGVLNREQAKVVTSFEGCAANPLPTFNPQNKQEPERLQRYTNMANFTEFAGKKNGPDIHPTPLGYEKLASIMSTECVSFFH